MAGTLILVRHGQSEWNLKNLFTGWKNPDLTEKGIEEARAAGRRLKAAGITPTVFFTSALKRAQHSLDLMLEELGIHDVETLAAQEPEALHDKLREYNRRERLARRSPTPEEVSDWVAQARRLPKLVTYRARTTRLAAE